MLIFVTLMGMFVVLCSVDSVFLLYFLIGIDGVDGVVL